MKLSCLADRRLTSLSEFSVGLALSICFCGAGLLVTSLPGCSWGDNCGRGSRSVVPVESGSYSYSHSGDPGTWELSPQMRGNDVEPVLIVDRESGVVTFRYSLEGVDVDEVWVVDRTHP